MFNQRLHIAKVDVLAFPGPIWIDNKKLSKETHYGTSVISQSRAIQIGNAGKIAISILGHCDPCDRPGMERTEQALLLLDLVIPCLCTALHKLDSRHACT